jgi:hypothetical protein
MELLTKDQERLLERLIELAGDPLIVQEALRRIVAEEAEPTLDDLIRKILALRKAETTPA